jgi:hypothetical protein
MFRPFSKRKHDANGAAKQPELYTYEIQMNV